MKKILPLVFIFLFMVTSLNAIDEWIDFGGDLRLYQEFYEASSEEKSYRPSATSRAFFLNPDIYLFDKALSVNLKFRLTTEDDKLRQNLQNITLNPEWSWGELYGFNFTPKISPYTLNGLNMRGGGVKFTPSVFRIFFFMGQSKNAVCCSGTDASFRQNMFGFKFGFGQEERTYVDFNMSKFVDDINSLADSLVYEDSVIVDSFFSDSIYQERDTSTDFLLTSPQENLVSSITYQIYFSKFFKIDGEVAACLFTRDLTAEQIPREESDFAAFLYPLFKIHQSSNYDFAYNFNPTLNMGNFKWKLGFSEIYPGYQSLGVPSLDNDKRVISSDLSFQLFSSKLKFKNSFRHQWDNLLGQDKYTNNSDRLSNNIMISPIKNLYLNLGFNFAQKTNSASIDTYKINYTQYSYNASSNYSLAINGRQYNINLSYMLQQIDNFSVFTESSKQNYSQYSLGLSIPINDNLSLKPTMNLSRMNILNETTFQTSIGNRITMNFWEGVLKGNVRTTIGLESMKSAYKFSTSWDIEPLKGWGNFATQYKISAYTFEPQSTENDYNERSFRIGYEYNF